MGQSKCAKAPSKDSRQSELSSQVKMETSSRLEFRSSDVEEMLETDLCSCCLEVQTRGALLWLLLG